MLAVNLTSASREFSCIASALPGGSWVAGAGCCCCCCRCDHHHRLRLDSFRRLLLAHPHLQWWRQEQQPLAGLGLAKDRPQSQQWLGSPFGPSGRVLDWG